LNNYCFYFTFRRSVC